MGINRGVSCVARAGLGLAKRIVKQKETKPASAQRGRRSPAVNRRRDAGCLLLCTVDGRGFLVCLSRMAQSKSKGAAPRPGGRKKANRAAWMEAYMMMRLR